MQKIHSYLSALLFAFLIFSCSDSSSASADAPAVTQAPDTATLSANQDEAPVDPIKPSGNADEKLIGSWLVINVVGEHRDLNMGLIYTWTTEGVMRMEREFAIEGNYTVKDGVIVWTTKDFEFTYDFTISGDLMTLIPRDSGHTYTLKRR